ncbi:MAG: hypothetical protein UU24_C0009G0004 [Candidatus Nomurabacteria bacterium GW2011_GWA2_40_9]|uniref:Transglutaminase-like domain-containing protein n=1 Tax=Candidatus Nomurabacteria bacterium GW2011_GWA2_40_9 TaxID=1618734 RepID=A0A0G0W588_9BACT|nr:MAG: hypothetical protein UU24_C0009G0004 [Candidatus Nomurabacteria bacterium GW2011_GWA2_40_9]
MFGLTKSELKILKKLSTPIKIQDFLDSMPVNWEKKGETYMSPRRSLKAKKMHCFEGALLAALALWLQGEKPLLMDFQNKGDEDHVIALYKRNGYWGAISKTNHSTLRYRDPVYKTTRELAMSYFHEYWRVSDGKKTLAAFSTEPFDLRKYGKKWVTAEEELFDVVNDMDDEPHTQIIPKKNKKFLRRADKMERRVGHIIEWSKTHPKT